MATELGVAYISIAGETKQLRKDVEKALNGVEKNGATQGRNYGNAFGAGAAGAMAGAGRNSASKFTSSFESEANTRATRIGSAVGTVLGHAVVGAAGAAAVGLGAVLFKGLDRYKSLDATAHRLGAMGKSASDVRTIMADINEVVEGTPIALDEASKSATQFLAAGVKQGQELKDVLTSIADASGFSGDSFDAIAQGFIQVQNAGKLTAEDLQNQFRNLPLVPWLAKSMGTDPASVKKMVSEGQIGIQQVIAAVEQNAGGMAKAAGDTIDGALRNMSTAVAKTGANLLSAIFGDPLSTTEGPGGMVEALNKVNEKLNDVNAWVVAHQGEIKQFFTAAANTAKDLFNAVTEVGAWMVNNKEIIIAIGLAFGTWKIAGLLGEIKTLGGLLGTAGAAGAGGAGILGQLSTAAALAGLASVASVGTGAQDVVDAGGDLTTSRFGPRPGHSGAPSGLPGQRGGLIPGGGGPGAQAQRRGVNNAQDPTGGLLGAGAGVAPASAVTPGGISGPMVDSIAAQFGLTKTSGSRPGDDGYHGSGQAGDYGGSVADMQAFAAYMSQNYGSGLAEIIFDAKGWAGNVKNGQNTGAFGNVFTMDQAGYHGDHVHVAWAGFDTGGWLGTGTTVMQNNTGKPELVLNPEQIKWLQEQGIDPNAVLSGNAPPPPGMPQGQQQGMGRTEGYIPGTAGFTGKTGGGVAGSLLNLASEGIQGAIDQAASGAAMGANAFAPGAGMAIQMGAQAAKRGVQYGFDMANIGVGAFSEIFMPFGAPRWLSDVDPMSFVPRTGTQAAATTTAEQAPQVDPNTTQHGQGMGAAPGPVNALGNVPTPEVEPAGDVRMGDTINLYPKDVDESMRLLRQREKLNMMQYGGRP